MKAVANGGLHMSILDGWWDEGYRAGLGWAIGAGEQYLDMQYQDEIESRDVYEILEREVIPLFYDRGRDGLPRGWIERMKASMRSLCPRFNTHRMVEDYVDRYYVPASVNYARIQSEGFRKAKCFADWKRKVWDKWGSVAVVRVATEETGGEVRVNADFAVETVVRLGELRPEDVRVDICFGPLDTQGDLVESRSETMSCDKDLGGSEYLYRGRIAFRQTGKLGFAVRVMPEHELLVHPMDMGLVVWG